MSEWEYPWIRAERKRGHEPFVGGAPSDCFCLSEFWQWAWSDLLLNTTRGVLAEYLVARAMGASGGVRDGWAAWDVETPPPESITIEVKSASYLQSWSHKRLSKIRFRVAKTRAWDANNGWTEKKRHAQIYVFAVLAHKNQDSIDPMKLDQWEFYVVPTAELDDALNDQKEIGLKKVQSLSGSGPVKFEELESSVLSKATPRRARKQAG